MKNKSWILICLAISFVGSISACTTNNDLNLGDDMIICSGECIYRNESNLSQFVNCDNTVFCKFTSFFPNGTLLIAYGDMVRNSTHFEYNITNLTNTTGDYRAKFDCYRTKGWFTKEFLWTINELNESTSTTPERGTVGPTLDYNEYLTCSKVSDFINNNTIGEELSYNSTDLEYIQNELTNDLISVGIEEIESYILDPNICEGFEINSFKIRVPEIEEPIVVEKTFFEKYKLWIIYLSITGVGILLFTYNKSSRKKSKKTVKSIIQLK